MKISQLFEIKDNSHIEQISKDPKEIAILLDKHCSHAMLRRSYLYRGMSYHHSAFIGDPSMLGRRSRNTSNFYTIFFDETFKEAGIPLRSESYICGNRDNNRYVEDFGYKFAVFPFNNAPIGYTSGYDLWNTQVRLFGVTMSLDDANQIFDNYLFDLNDKSWADFQTSLKRLCTKYENGESSDRKIKLSPKFGNREFSYDEIIEEIKRAYSPSALRINSSNTKIAAYDDDNPRECWTSGKCIFVDASLVDEVFNEYHRLSLKS
jgi:hypothetical protein